MTDQPTPEETHAAAQALADLGLGVTTPTGAEPGEGTVQILIRVPARTRDRWKHAAEAHGLSMSEFIRTTVEPTVDRTLDCPHERRRIYPWAQFCVTCGKRIPQDQWTVPTPTDTTFDKRRGR